MGEGNGGGGGKINLGLSLHKKNKKGEFSSSMPKKIPWQLEGGKKNTSSQVCHLLGLFGICFKAKLVHKGISNPTVQADWIYIYHVKADLSHKTHFRDACS